MPRSQQKSWYVDSNAPLDGSGSHDDPFSTVSEALAQAGPGERIILLAGRYVEKCTVEISGTIDSPIRIGAEPGAIVEIVESCWYFYGTSDLIVENLVFRDAPVGAISLVGTCNRNIFRNLTFDQCGTKNVASCTLFFGGSGCQCNVVADSRFIRNIPGNTPAATSQAEATIALMIAEGDAGGNEANLNHVVRNNFFSGYDYGIMLGSSDINIGNYGHVVSGNTIEKCAVEGLLVKCGDTRINNNLVLNCPKGSVTVLCGEESMIEDNRIVDSGRGLVILGCGHTVRNNCFVRCQGEAVHVSAGFRDGLVNATNILIERNTCIDCGDGPNGQDRVAGARIDKETSCIVLENLFDGEGLPYSATLDRNVQISKNRTSGRCAPLAGCDFSPTQYVDRGADNFTNESGFGASGWVLTSLPPVAAEELTLSRDEFEAAEEARLAAEQSDEDTVADSHSSAIRSFFQAEQE